MNYTLYTASTSAVFFLFLFFYYKKVSYLEHNIAQVTQHILKPNKFTCFNELGNLATWQTDGNYMTVNIRVIQWKKEPLVLLVHYTCVFNILKLEK